MPSIMAKAPLSLSSIEKRIISERVCRQVSPDHRAMAQRPLGACLDVQPTPVRNDSSHDKDYSVVMISI